MAKRKTFLITYTRPDDRLYPGILKGPYLTEVESTTERAAWLQLYRKIGPNMHYVSVKEVK